MINGDATFVAPATPYGHSGLAVVRINGPKSLETLSKLAPNTKLKDRSAVLSKIRTSSGELIDECVVTFFKSPKSYTGDDLIEISCHGSPSVVDRLIDEIIKHDVRPAEPGEFTKRAFLNGKIDLIQSEAIASLIESKTTKSAQIHSNTLDGVLSKTLINTLNKLISILADIEHAIDISEDEITDRFYRNCKDKIGEVHQDFKDILSTYNIGKLLNDGIRVVITGKPNVGKSTLLNQLSGLEKALVSDQPGTTRDLVEVVLDIDGIPVRFIDTAGIHITDDKVENLGIKKAVDSISRSDLVLHVTDDLEYDYFTDYDVPSINILNKIDLHKKTLDNNSIIHISAKNGENVDILLKKIKETLLINSVSTNTPHLTTARQKEALNKCLESLSLSLKCFDNSYPDLEIVSLELRASLYSLETLLGKTSADDILNNVFGKMCVGK